MLRVTATVRSRSMYGQGQFWNDTLRHYGAVRIEGIAALSSTRGPSDRAPSFKQNQNISKPPTNGTVKVTAKFIMPSAESGDL